LKPSRTLSQRVQELYLASSEISEELDDVDELFQIFPQQPPSTILHIFVTFDIDIIDDIEMELESLRGVVETFLKNPEPPAWVPPDHCRRISYKPSNPIMAMATQVFYFTISMCAMLKKSKRYLDVVHTWL
jgi:hypothetical protein